MKVILVGFGAMGKLIHQKLKEHNHEIVGVVSLDQIKDIYEIQEAVDVIIDFSHPSNLDQVLSYAIQKKLPLVLATTGFDDTQVASIYDASKQIPIVYTANFSLGMTVLEAVLKDVSPILRDYFDIEIIEKHHNKKIDAPSGSAKMLLHAVDPNHDYNHVYGREGYSKRAHEIGIHAIRGGTIVGEHSVIFAGEDEVLEFKHEAHSKAIFANGAIHAAEYIIKQEIARIYTMHDVLFPKKQ